jgi:excisionase family DNA binding protein
MEIRNLENPKDYLSTRQSARYLQVSLGTVQKMVETGELLAWKTQGGHRRILTSSLEQLLKRRRLGIRQRCGAQFLLLAIMKREGSFEGFQALTEEWKSDVNLHMTADSLEALMQSVSLAPDVIYIDAQISPVEQVHLTSYLSKNTHTRNIPILVEDGFLKLHPQILDIYPEHKLMMDSASPIIKSGKKMKNPLIRSYKSDLLILEDGSPNIKFGERLELLIIDCMAKKCEAA